MHLHGSGITPRVTSGQSYTKDEGSESSPGRHLPFVVWDWIIGRFVVDSVWSRNVFELIVSRDTREGLPAFRI